MVQLMVSLDDGTVAYYTIHEEFWEKDIEPLLGATAQMRC